MDIQKVEDITANWSEFSKLDESVASTKISEIWKNGIKEASDKFVADMSAKDSALAEAQDKISKAVAEVEALKKLHTETSAQLEQILASQKAAQDQEVYSGRLAQLEDEYDLEDEDRQAIASEILGLDDEAFAGFQKKFSSLAKYKSKKFKKDMEEKVKAECMKELQEKSKASISTAATKTAEEIAQEALASVTATTAFVPSAHVETETNLFDKYTAAFGKDAAKVTYKTR